MVKDNPFWIYYIENPSEELQLLALKANKESFRYIRNKLTEKSALELVSNDGLMYKDCYSKYFLVQKVVGILIKKLFSYLLFLSRNRK